MAAIATEKVQSTALNLGFPHAYASVYAAARKPTAYFPSFAAPSQPYVGDADIQALRLSRKAEADFMANAKVRATNVSDARYTSSPHGRGFIPKPVLGQRVFANPSNGDSSIYSTRQNHASAPFHFVDSLAGYSQKVAAMNGGVLRTREGQIYGKEMLNRRVGQLNKIADAVREVGKAPEKTTTGPIPGALPGDVEQTKIQLNLALQQLTDGANEAQAAMNRLIAEAEDEDDDEDAAERAREEGDDEVADELDENDADIAAALRKLNAVVGNVTQFGFGQIYTILRLLFVLAPVMSEDDLNDVNRKVSAVNAVLEEVADEVGVFVRRYGDRAVRNVSIENMLSLSAMLVRMTAYTDEMVKGVNRPENERRIQSNALIKSLKFGKDLKRTGTPFLTGLVHPDEQNQIRLAQNAILAEEPEEYVGRGKGSRRGFSRRGNVREDDEQPNVERGERSGFSANPREAFGYASGEWYASNGRDSAAFFNQPSGSKNSNGPGWEAIKTMGKPLGSRISRTYDKVTGGYNVAFH
jgi:hypothetical protein